MLSQMSSDLKKIILAGIGAVATTMEKSEDVVKGLVSKGELTVEQGKALNQELKHKFHEAQQNAKVTVEVEHMSQAERAALKRQLEELDAKEAEQARAAANKTDEPENGQ